MQMTKQANLIRAPFFSLGSIENSHCISAEFVQLFRIFEKSARNPRIPESCRTNGLLLTNSLRKKHGKTCSTVPMYPAERGQGTVEERGEMSVTRKFVR